MLLKTDGVVLKQSKFGERNAVITIFSKKLGKIQGVVKGSTRGKGKYKVGTEPFCFGEFMLIKGRDLYQISQVDLKNSFYKLREDVIKLSYASYILELTERVIIEGQTNNRLFYTLIKCLNILSIMNKEYETLVKGYELKLLMYSGYRPEIENCVLCGNSSGQVKFSAKEGGLICKSCHHADPYAMKISSVTINVMKYLMDTDLEQLMKRRIKPEVLMELKKIVRSYIHAHIEKTNFKSLQFLDSIQI